MASTLREVLAPSAQHSRSLPCAQFWPPYCMKDASGGSQEGQELEHKTWTKAPKELNLFSLQKGEVDEICLHLSVPSVEVFKEEAEAEVQ